ncbi:MAG: hypothetical protein JSW00_01385 [Thermoplasmata archaeon]|nr:MAG: hypothetical protein JSW00_01385 [Thermoplasmata archaeon]
MEGVIMSLIDQLKGNGNEAPTKVYALVFVISFIVLAGNIIILWVNFLPQMQDAAEETEEIIEDSEEGNPIIRADAIPKIRFVYILYLICFGILDSVLALMLWRNQVPKSQEPVIKALANTYVFVRLFNIFIITMLSIIVLVGSDYLLALNLLYVSILFFSIVSLFYIIYLKRKILSEKMDNEITFKIPDEVTP